MRSFTVIEDLDSSSYRVSLINALLQENQRTQDLWELVYSANRATSDLLPVTVDVLQTALKEEQWDAVLNLTMVHLATSQNAHNHFQWVTPISSWKNLYYLLRKDIPREIRKHLTTTYSKHKLLTIFSQELVKSPYKHVDFGSLVPVEVLFCMLVREGPRHFDIASNLVLEIGSNFSRGPDILHRFLAVNVFYTSIKKYICALDADLLDEFDQRLVREESTVCHYLAALLAADRNKWTLVENILRDKPSVVHLRGLDFFPSALSSGSYSCAAFVLDSLLTFSAQNQHMGLNINVFLTLISMDTQCQFRKAQLPSFLSVCIELNLPAAGAVMAMWFYKLRTARRFMSSVMEDGSVHRLLLLMMKLTRDDLNPWPLALDMLKTRPNLEARQIVLKKACEMCQDVRSGNVVTQLLDAVQDPMTAHVVLSQIVKNRQPRLLKLCMAKGLLKFLPELYHKSTDFFDLLREVLRSVTGAPVMVDGAMQFCLISEQERQDSRAMLRLCVEAGLTTQMQDPLRLMGASQTGVMGTPPLMMLIYSESYDLLELLHRTGAVSNLDLHALSNDLLLHICLERDNLLHRRVYMDQAVSSVRSLENLCALVVSHCIGFYVDRKERALSLSLPSALVNTVLFYDVLYPD